MATVDLAALKRRRGAIKASITKLATKIADLEGKEASPTILTHAQQLSKRLESLDGDFKTRHFAVIDVLDDEGQLAVEQDALDKHDDELADLNLRLQALMNPAATTPPPSATPAPEARLLPRRAILE